MVCSLLQGDGRSVATRANNTIQLLAKVVLVCVFLSNLLAFADTSSSIAVNFNGTAIPAGSYLWFSSALKPSGLGTQPVTIFVRNSSIQFVANGATYTVPIPDADITFDPAATTAATTFNPADNAWHTTVPSTGLAGNILLDAGEFVAPAGGLPAGMQGVTWKTNFSTDTAGISLQWKWAAAVYTTFSTDYNNLAVKPVDDNSTSQYKNSDHAGTPENYKASVVGGATGGGGSNYTGGLSGTLSTNVAVNQPPSANAGGPYSGIVGLPISFSGASSTDPDGDQLTYSWNFGDGSSNTGAAPTHTYVSAGNFTVTLTVSDGRNATATTTTAANVVPPTPPSISATASPAPNAQGWNNTPVTVTFTCSQGTFPIATCPNPATVSTDGAGQVVTGTVVDTAGITAGATVTVNVDQSSPAITPTITPAPNGAGWNNAAVTVSFACSDTPSGIASCPSSASVATEGAGQEISGTAYDRAGNAGTTSTTVNLDFTPPAISVSSPTDGSTVDTPNIQLIGSATDNLSGVSTITCNGLSGNLSSGAFTCNLSLLSGPNTIQLQTTDNAGNTATSSISITYGAVLNPPPSAVYITPDNVAVVATESRKLALVDDLARAIPATNWTSSDSRIVSAAADGTITAVASGTATITGIYQSLSATAQVTVYDGSFLQPGTVRWSVQPLPGNQVIQVSPGRPSDPTQPDLYVFEQGPSGLVMRGITSDGQQRWIYPIAPTISTSASAAITTNTASGALSAAQTGVMAKRLKPPLREHRWGKKITAFLNEHSMGALKSGTGASGRLSANATSSSTASSSLVEQTILSAASTDSNNRVINLFERLNVYPYTDRDNIIVVDSNGNELWRWSVDGGEMGYALHPEGIVYILQADYINNSLFTLFAKDETTGQDRFPPIQLPMSEQGTLQPYPGLPSVLPDGNLYLPVEHADDYTTDKLDLLKVAPDGTYTWIPLFTGGFCGVFGEFTEPHEVIPYGTDKFLVIWDKAYFQSCQPNAPSEVAVFTIAGQLVNQYPIPLTRLGSYFSDNDGDVALGTEGNGYITGAVIGSNIVTPILSFNVDTGQLTGQNYTPSSVIWDLNFEVDSNNQLVVSDPVNNSIERVDPTGTITADSWTSLVPAGAQGFVYDAYDPVQMFFAAFPPDSPVEQFYSFYPNLFAAGTTASSSGMPSPTPSGAAAIVGNASTEALGPWPWTSEKSMRRAEGPPATIYLRSFAPWDWFGPEPDTRHPCPENCFKGDNRSFTTDLNVTSRITGYVTVRLPWMTKVFAWAYSDPTYDIFGNTATEHPKITVTSGGGSLHIATAGSNPLVRLAPDIDTKVDIRTQVNSGIACYSGHLYGDAFPDAEVFVLNSLNQPTMLITFATQGTPNLGPVLLLPGDNNDDMGSFSSVCAPE